MTPYTFTEQNLYNATQSVFIEQKYLMTSSATATKNRVSAISLLNDNWDGFGGVKPSKEIIKNTFRFLDIIIDKDIIDMIGPEDICPTPYGTISIEFETKQGCVSVEIGKDEIGYFSDFSQKENISSNGVPVSNKELPKQLEEALFFLLRTYKLNYA